jgi:hypothetical protein
MRDEKPQTTKALFADIGLAKKYCRQWNCLGMKCKNTNCPGPHDSLIQMDKDDLNKILNNLLKTKAAYLNPTLAKNRRFVGMLTDEQKNLFPPGTVLTGEDNGGSEA